MSLRDGGDSRSLDVDADMIGRLRAIAAAATDLIARHIGPPPFGPVHVSLTELDGRDGLAEPGHVVFDRGWARSAEPVYQLLTVAHEVAHQWWGLGVRGQRLLGEP